MEKDIENNSFNNIKVLSIGVIVSILTTIIMVFGLSIIITYTNTSEKIIEGSIIFISAFSILIGSFFSLKKIKQKGLLYGGALGFVYMILIYLLSSIIIKNFSIDFNAIIMILFGIISGIAGGIISVNIKN